MEDEKLVNRDLLSPEEAPEMPGNEELSEEDLNGVSGGIIFVGGHKLASQQTKASLTHTNFQTLNPQPIPPGKTNKLG